MIIGLQIGFSRGLLNCVVEGTFSVDATAQQYVAFQARVHLQPEKEKDHGGAIHRAG